MHVRKSQDFNSNRRLHSLSVDERPFANRPIRVRPISGRHVIVDVRPLARVEAPVGGLSREGGGYASRGVRREKRRQGLLGVVAVEGNERVMQEV